MCLASGITTEAIAAEGGDSPAKGAWTCRSKKIAPVRRTAFSTSERTSIAVPLVPDDRARKADNQITSISACADALYVLPLEVGAQRSERRALTMQVGRGGWHGISGSSEVRAGCTDRREPRSVERAQHGGESSILDRDCRLENGRRVQAASGPAADTKDAVL